MTNRSHPHYKRWMAMRERCSWSKHHKFADYGGRGIKVCPQWADFQTYLADIAHLGPCPPGYTLDRIDNDGNYEPGNVRWASPAEQLANRRQTRFSPHVLSRKTVILRDGVPITQRKAAQLLGVKQRSVAKRLKRMRKTTPDLKEIELSRLRT